MQIYKTNPTQPYKQLLTPLTVKTPEDLWLQSLEKTIQGVLSHFIKHIITIPFIIIVITSGIAPFPKTVCIVACCETSEVLIEQLASCDTTVCEKNITYADILLDCCSTRSRKKVLYFWSYLSLVLRTTVWSGWK